MTTNTPYPSRKIWRIRACTHQRPRRKQAQYAVSIKEDMAYPCLHSPKTTKETSSIRRDLDNSKNNVLIPLDSWTNGLLVYRFPLSDAKTAIQEMAEYSQKWHNGTSRGRSTETSDGLAAIQAQLNNLGREIKKVNEKVFAAQVGCEQ
ncbi:hypothetical protein Tco_0559732 [Tanacetum coccineum]